MTILLFLLLWSDFICGQEAHDRTTTSLEESLLRSIQGSCLHIGGHDSSRRFNFVPAMVACSMAQSQGRKTRAAMRWTRTVSRGGGDGVSSVNFSFCKKATTMIELWSKTKQRDFFSNYAEEIAVALPLLHAPVRKTRIRPTVGSLDLHTFPGTIPTQSSRRRSTS